MIRSQTLAYIAFLSLPHISEFNFTPVDDTEVEKSILAIKSKAVGSDDISRGMIVYILDYVLLAVTHIINFSLDSLNT